MKKTAILLLSVLLCFILYGCSDVNLLKTQDADDPLSQILYDAVPDTLNELSADIDMHPDLAGIFDNIGEENALEADSVVAKTETDQESVHNDEAEITQISESVSAFAYTGQGDVWISATGKKYHSKSDCSGMKSPLCVTKVQAELDGYTPCKRCFKNN